jgi:hypothetical protein
METSFANGVIIVHALQRRLIVGQPFTTLREQLLLGWAILAQRTIPCVHAPHQRTDAQMRMVNGVSKDHAHAIMMLVKNNATISLIIIWACHSTHKNLLV